MTFDRDPFSLSASLLQWLQVFGGFTGVVFAVTVLAALGVYGASGPVAVMTRVWQGLHDFLSLSARRIWAIAVLTIMEAVRRKALMVFVVFAALMMFAGWFLESDLRSDLQVKNAVSFALTTVSWLTIPVMLLLSCWGIPEDIRLRSIHTVVTKPVRRNEIVIGRILGFSMVAALIVALMGAVGYVWIDRQLFAGKDERARELLRQQLICRVPVYGKLSFLDREGNPGVGVNTGDIWEFRSYIEGGTKAAAIYDFPKDLRVPLESFEISEFGLNEMDIDRQISYYDEDSKETRTVDLFDGLVDRGQLRIEVQCMDSGQYLGMARPDMFLRLPDRSFAVGYFKAIVGVLLLAVFLISIGVTASTFVKGPVATLLTFTVLIIGYPALADNESFRTFMNKLVTGVQKGGGPLESSYRLFKHMNDTVNLADNAGKTLAALMQGIDNVMFGGLWLVQHLVPDLSF